MPVQRKFAIENLERVKDRFLTVYGAIFAFPDETRLPDAILLNHSFQSRLESLAAELLLTEDLYKELKDMVDSQK